MKKQWKLLHDCFEFTSQDRLVVIGQIVWLDQFPCATTGVDLACAAAQERDERD